MKQQIPEGSGGENPAAGKTADFPVLTVNTAKAASGKEYGPGPAAPADAGLLAEMRGSADDSA